VESSPSIPRAWHLNKSTSKKGIVALFDSAPFWEGVHINVDLFNAFVGASATRYDVLDGEVLDIPVLVAVGRHDYAAPFSLWEERYQRSARLPQLTFRLFEESGHTPQYEQAQEFDRTLREWLVNQP
jgi:proline iminopeptidase